MYNFVSCIIVAWDIVHISWDKDSRVFISGYVSGYGDIFVCCMCPSLKISFKLYDCHVTVASHLIHHFNETMNIAWHIIPWILDDLLLYTVTHYTMDTWRSIIIHCHSVMLGQMAMFNHITYFLHGTSQSREIYFCPSSNSKNISI